MAVLRYGVDLAEEENGYYLYAWIARPDGEPEKAPEIGPFPSLAVAVRAQKKLVSRLKQTVESYVQSQNLLIKRSEAAREWRPRDELQSFPWPRLEIEGDG